MSTVQLSSLLKVITSGFNLCSVDHITEGRSLLDRWAERPSRLVSS